MGCRLTQFARNADEIRVFGTRRDGQGWPKEHFKTGALNRSATLPEASRQRGTRWRRKGGSAICLSPVGRVWFGGLGLALAGPQSLADGVGSGARPGPGRGPFVQFYRDGAGRRARRHQPGRQFHAATIRETNVAVHEGHSLDRAAGLDDISRADWKPGRQASRFLCHDTLPLVAHALGAPMRSPNDSFAPRRLILAIHRFRPRAACGGRRPARPC
jgi:hypothetical protein